MLDPRRCLRAGSLLACLLAATGIGSAQPLPRAAQPNYDFHDARSSPPAGRKSLATIRQTAGLVSDHTAAAGPRSIYDLTGPLTAPRPGDAETVARDYLRTHQKSLAIRAESAFDLPLAARYESQTAGLTHLVFRPSYAGVPFFDSDVQVHLDRDGRVWRASMDGGVTAPASLAVRLTPQQAVEVALASLGPVNTSPLQVLTPESGPERRAVFVSQQVPSPIPVSLTWFPSAEFAAPGWQMYLELDAAHAYWLVVEGNSGEILFSRNLARHAGPQGRVLPAPAVAHPEDGAWSRQPLTGWPTAQGSCPAEVYPSQFRSGAAKDRCWVATTETLGNNVDACPDADSNNLCDSRPSRQDAILDFPFTDSYSQSLDPIPDRGAAVTNAFYWANTLHDWLYRLGFDEAAGNFQADNFGRGGVAADAVRVDVHDGGDFGIANFLTPPDGIAPRMQLALYPSLRRDAAFDADVIIHEYVHGLTFRLIGGPASVTGLYLWQSGALAEGWSDAYAASFTGDPVIAEYVSRNPRSGIRTVAYDNSPLRFGQFGLLRAKTIPNSNGLVLRLPQVHRDGEIWATVLWDLREALGQEVFEPLVTTALKLTPRRPSMLDARNAIVQAALVSGAGGPKACAVWAVFAARGFGFSAALNPLQPGQPNDTALSVYESFDLPTSCGGAPPVPGTTLFLEDAEGSPSGWTASSLWHRTKRRSAGGTGSWWFGQESSGDYHTGVRLRGSLTSPPIDLSAVSEATLEWDQFFRTEGFGQAMDLDGPFGPYLNADSGQLLVSSDAGFGWVPLTNLAHNSPGNGFARYKINLSPFVGSTIRLRFDFDTFDGISNTYEGWYLDNIRVSGVQADPPRLLVGPGALIFSAVQGGPDPESQTVTIDTAESSGLRWSVSVRAGAPWLRALPAEGSGPAVLTVSAGIGGLAPGRYDAAIEVNAPGAFGSPAAIPVTLSLADPGTPAASWSFEETALGPGVTLSDSSGNGHDAVTEGASIEPITGVDGLGRRFAGFPSYARLAPHQDLSSGSFSFATWIKLEAYPSSWGVVFANHGGADYQGWYLAVLNDGRVILCVAGLPQSSPWVLSSGRLEAGRWRHVAVTFDGPTRRGVIYLDGVADRAATFPVFTPQTRVAPTFGRASWYDGYYLQARLDEARLYPAAAPAEVVRSEAARPEHIDESPPPVAWWPFDEAESGSGIRLADHSGRGHHATPQGAGTSAAGGIVGGARRFDGFPGYASLDPHPELSTASFSFTTWIKLESLPGAWGVVFANHGGAEFRGWFAGVFSDGRVILSVAGPPAHSPWVLSRGRLTSGQWHHLGVTFDGVTRRGTIYLDGATDRTAVFPAFAPQTSLAPTFARASWHNGAYLKAVLDEAKLYALELTPYDVGLEYETAPAQAKGGEAAQSHDRETARRHARAKRQR